MTREEIIDQLKELVKEYNFFFGLYACFSMAAGTAEEAKSNPSLADMTRTAQAFKEAIKLLEEEAPPEKELEAAKKDIRELIMLEKYPGCGRFCKNFSECIRHNDDYEYVCDDHAEWRGLCAENGGSEDGSQD